jgi:hypothetical protein
MRLLRETGEGRLVKKVSIRDFLTTEQIKKVIEIGPDKDRLKAEIILPNLAEINRKLGQENDPDYLAYMLVNLMS